VSIEKLEHLIPDSLLVFGGMELLNLESCPGDLVFEIEDVRQESRTAQRRDRCQVEILRATLREVEVPGLVDKDTKKGHARGL